MSWKVSVAPEDEPISRDTMKNWLKMEGTTADDTLIDGLIKSVRTYAENHTNLGLLPQTIVQKVDQFPSVGNIILARGPLRTVSQVTYKDAAGDTQTLATSIYGVAEYAKPAEIYLKNGQSWPETLKDPESIEITYTVGFDNAGSVPANLITAMELLTTYYYEERTDRVKRYRTAAELLLDQEKVFVF